jgi:dihydroorotate dehydrogenase
MQLSLVLPRMYRFFRNILFCFPPEWTHYFSMNSLRLLCAIGFRPVLKKIYHTKGDNSYTMYGLQFSNRVGLGAGFDKNAKYLRELETLGFGSVEIGTVTPLPQGGNDKPRLFRLPKDKALINRMGFNNEGVKVVAARLKTWRTSSLNRKSEMRNTSGTVSHSRFTIDDSRLIIGGNIGKNKATSNEHAWKDYEICFNELHPYVDYFVVNVSSPNTPGLRELQEKQSLKKILTNLQMLNTRFAEQKPLLLKIAPDLTKEQIDDVVSLSIEIKLDGLVVSNTTTSRDGLKTDQEKLKKIGAGGLSGIPLKKRSTEIVKYICAQTDGLIPVIASGGIFTGPDAKEKIDAGASIVQVWTGFIYEGPAIVKKICKFL